MAAPESATGGSVFGVLALALWGAAWVIVFLAGVCSADRAGTAFLAGAAVALRVCPEARDAGLAAALPPVPAFDVLAGAVLVAAAFGLTSRTSDSATRLMALAGVLPAFFAGAAFVTAFFGAALLTAAVLGAVFFDTAFFAGVALVAAAFFATGFFAATFFTTVFFAATFFAAGIFTVAFFAAAAPAGPFFATALVAGRAAGFFTALPACAAAFAGDRSDAFAFVATVEAPGESSLSTSGRVL